MRTRSRTLIIGAVIAAGALAAPPALAVVGPTGPPKPPTPWTVTAPAKPAPAKPGAWDSTDHQGAGMHHPGGRAVGKHVVVKGDTLIGLFGRHWRHVANLNKIDDPNLIMIGQVLRYDVAILG